MIPPAATSRGLACVSDLELDEMIAGDLVGNVEEAHIRRHLMTCSRCRDRLAAFSAVEPPSFSTMRARIFKDSTRARRRPGRRLAAATAFAAAAAGLVLTWRLVVKPTEPTVEIGRTKGGLGLTVMVKRVNGTIERVTGEGRLQAGDEMRFSIATSKAGYAVVLGLDSVPSVTIYAPVAPSLAPVRIEGAGSVTLPGSIVADATPGTERIAALVCPEPTPPETLRGRAEAALGRAHGQPDRVAPLGTGCLETSVLMRKGDRSSP